MGAIFRREFRTYFTSPIGYVVLAIMYFFSGLYFATYNIYSGSADLTYVYQGLFTIVLLLVLPVLTMRLMSDDKRQKTDQALLTAPVSLTGIVLGKFLAALLVFAIGVSITLVYAVFIAFFVSPDWLVIFGNYFGMLMMGGMIIAVGMLISSLTESQFIAALGTFVVSFAWMMVDNLSSTDNAVVKAIVNFLSLSGRYDNFTIGVMEYDNIFFFLSMQVLFLFFTVRVLDKKRWS